MTFPIPPRSTPFLTLLVSLLVAACSDGADSTPAAKVQGAPPNAIPTNLGSTPNQPGAADVDPAFQAFESGRRWTEGGEPERAVEDFRRAIQLDPKMAEAHFELGMMLVHMSYLYGAAQRDGETLDQAIEALEAAVALRPNNDEYAYRTGVAYHLRKNTQKAVELLTKATSINPESGAAHKRLGLIHRELSEMDAARANFEAALPLIGSEDAGLHFQYGMVLEQLEDYEGAEKAFQTAIATDATLPGPYSRLAFLLRQRGEEAEADEVQAQYERWKAFDDGLRVRIRNANQKSNDPQALLVVGEEYYSVEKWDEALEWFERVMVLAPDDALNHLYCGIVKDRLEDFEGARNHLEEAAYLQPGWLEPLMELVRFYTNSVEEPERLAEVKASLEELVAEDGAALYLVGLLYEDLGQGDESKTYLDRGIAASTDAEGLFQLGIVCDQNGRLATAKGFFEQALESDESHVMSHLALGQIMLAEGQRDAASRHIQRVLELDPVNPKAAELKDLLAGEEGQ